MVEEIFDNCNCKRLVYADLCVGTRLRAKVGVVSIDDIGYSGRTFNYSAFIEGNEYEVVSSSLLLLLLVLPLLPSALLLEGCLDFQNCQKIA